MSDRPLLRLYGREYCDLCQQMRQQLLALAPQKGFALAWFDIDDDDDLEARYTTLVPVLAGQDEEIICFYHLDARKLDAYLSRIR